MSPTSLCALTLAQGVSVGVTGGVPVSPWSEIFPQLSLYTGTPMYGPNELYTKPCAIGPTVDVSLPRNLSIEAGLLCQRLHQDVTTGLILATGELVSFGYRQDVAGNQWLFSASPPAAIPPPPSPSAAVSAGACPSSTSRPKSDPYTAPRPIFSPPGTRLC